MALPAQKQQEQQKKHDLVVYETPQGKITLSPNIVKRYLASGDPSKVTDQEVMMFIALCRYQKLNPFLREAYLIKFGQEPATIVVGKDTFTKRAASLKECNGWEAGIIVENTNGEVEYRKGHFYLPEKEKLLGGWARVHRKDWGLPLETSVSLHEYERHKKDGSLMANWKSMPATMIRKVALVQCLREAFPDQFQGMYAPEEMPIDATILDDKPVNMPIMDTQTGEEPAKAQAQKKQSAKDEVIAKVQFYAGEKGYDPAKFSDYVSAVLCEGYEVSSVAQLTEKQWQAVAKNVEKLLKKAEERYVAEEIFPEDSEEEAQDVEYEPAGE